MEKVKGNDVMEIKENIAWIYYIGDTSKFIKDKVGKWMYFFGDRSFIEKICQECVEKNIVSEAKHSNADNGVACFYTNIDDIESHKKILEYFIENNMIKKTKSGRFYNISFKLDSQTLDGKYGENFVAEVKLDQFLDLDTGEWKI